MNEQLLTYSLDPELTLGNLKKGKNLNEINVQEKEKLEKWMEKNNIGGIIQGGSDFNYKFLGIKSRPYIVYYKGDLSLLNKPILGIVGPRKMSEYAQKVLEKIFEKINNYDLVTISGMAQGVDSLCHNLSIENNVPTIAVLGGGLKWHLESKHRNMINKIVDNGGLVLSEFKLNFVPTNFSFPQRNRIIAGLSDVLFLPEASKKSGSLITAQFAIEMKKSVYASSNGIFASNSQGVNQLISDGKIKMINDVQIFLDKFFKGKNLAESLNPEAGSKEKKNLSEEENQILNFIAEKNGCGLQELIKFLGMTAEKILGIMTILEMNNFVYQESPGIYKVC
ncbi:MAG: DNA-processing protein DprA [Candidatus Absconditabacterales bacterium]